jgi:predicted HicB family RNase H-like nuclease
MGRPRVYEEQRRTTAVRLPPALHDRLRAEATARNMSANLLVEHAIGAYLDRLAGAETLGPAQS